MRPDLVCSRAQLFPDISVLISRCYRMVVGGREGGRREGGRKEGRELLIADVHLFAVLERREGRRKLKREKENNQR